MLPATPGVGTKTDTWKPDSTTSLYSSIGLSAGMIIALPVTGFLAKYGLNGGWPTVFYVFGKLGSPHHLLFELRAVHSFCGGKVGINNKF